MSASAYQMSGSSWRSDEPLDSPHPLLVRLTNIADKAIRVARNADASVRIRIFAQNDRNADRGSWYIITSMGRNASALGSLLMNLANCAAAVVALFLTTWGCPSVSAEPGEAGSQITWQADSKPDAANVVFTIDRDAIVAKNGPGSRFALSVPKPRGGVFNLVVEPIRVWAPGAQVVTVSASGETTVDIEAEQFVHLRGQIDGLDGSHVFLSIGPQTTIGRIELGASQPTYVITSNGGDPAKGGVKLSKDQAVVFQADQPFSPQTVATACGAPDSAPLVGPFVPEPRLGMRQTKLAVDTDYELFQIFNDEHTLIEYVTHLYATVGDLTLRDTGVRLDVIYLRIFTTPDDPYGPGAGFPILSRGEIGFDVAQLFSGSRQPSAGGAARICGRTSWVAHATGKFTDPTVASVFNQDLRITAHEIGHNIGGPHPHDLGVDQCDQSFARPRRGTLISYCAQTYSGRAALIDAHFHVRIRERIAGCGGVMTPDCNNNYLPDMLDIAEGRSMDANGNGIPDECEDCNQNGVLDSEDIASGMSADLNANGVPDECEPDCNNNGIPDSLDIAATNSRDYNGDGVPDECQADRDGNGVADWTDIFFDMSKDIDRDGILDATQDCDGDGVMDIDQLDHAHALWAASSGDGTVKEYHFRSGVLRGQAEGNYLVDPTDVLITVDRRVLVADAGDASIAEFDRDGAFVRDLVASGSGGLQSPIALAIAADGSLLVADLDANAVLRYGLDTGAFLGVFVEAGSGGLMAPYGMTVGPNGNLYVNGDHAGVNEYDGTTGAHVRQFIEHGSGGLHHGRGILFIPAPASVGVGWRCLVASGEEHNILEFDADTGEFIGVFNDGSFAGKLRNPWGLRQGPDGSVYVSSARLHHRTAPPPAGQIGPRTAGLHLTDPHIFQYDADSGRLLSAYVQGADARLDHPKGFDFMPGPLDRNANAIPDSCEAICPGDCDGSGSTDLLDFLCFQNAFSAGDPKADCTGDGVLDIFDFLCFLDVFEDGCD